MTLADTRSMNHDEQFFSKYARKTKGKQRKTKVPAVTSGESLPQTQLSLLSVGLPPAASSLSLIGLWYPLMVVPPPLHDGMVKISQFQTPPWGEMTQRRTPCSSIRLPAELAIDESCNHPDL